MSDIKITIGADIKNLQSELAKAGGVTREFAAKATTSMNSVGAATNKLTSSAVSFKNVAGSAFSSAASSIFSIINPATLAIAGIAILGRELYRLVTAQTAAQKSQQALNEALAQSEASVAGNVAKLTALVSIARDVTRSDNERKEALGVLNKEYDGFNGKLTLANINTAESTKLIDEQTRAIVRQAKIKGIENLISKEAAKNAEILTSKLGDQLTLLDKIRAAAITAINPSGGVVDVLTTAIERRNTALANGEKNINKYSEVLKQLLSDDAIDGTLFKEKKIKELKVKPDKIIFEPQEYKFSIEKIKPELTTGMKDVFSSLGTFIGREPIDLKIVPNKVKVTIDPAARVKILDGVSAESIKLAEDIQSIVQSVFVDSLAGIGELIGAAISSGNIENAFDGILKTLAGGIKAIGKALIEFGVQKLIIQKIGSINPYLAIAAGIAMVALGSALQSKIGKVKAYAVGTRFSGAETALVGERGPELITMPRGSSVTPAAQTANMLGGQQVFIAENVIRGTDIVTIFKKASAYNSRNGF